MALDGFIDDGDRCKCTAPNTRDPFNAELSVRGGFTIANAELSLEILEDDIAASHMTSRAETHLDVMFARWMEANLVIESRNTINLAAWEV